jgi:DNA end-binding protein Ku
LSDLLEGPLRKGFEASPGAQIQEPINPELTGDPTMPHSIWNGSLSFGLVNIPVGLYPAESPDDLDLTLLDRRNLSRVGYKKINKKTGAPIGEKDLVRGYEVSKGKFVLLNESDFKHANPKATQTVEIFGFVGAGDIPPIYFDKPYFIVPQKAGAKAYSLLREALLRSERIGLARLVVRTRQYLAAIYPLEEAIIVNLLRFAHELRDPAAYEFPKRGPVNAKEIQLAEKLIEGMDETWSPKEYKDEYRDDLLALIKKKAKRKGGAEEEAEVEPEEQPLAEVVDLMALLKKSLTPGKAPKTRTAVKRKAKPEKKEGTARRRAPQPRRKSA